MNSDRLICSNMPKIFGVFKERDNTERDRGGAREEEEREKGVR